MDPDNVYRVAYNRSHPRGYRVQHFTRTVTTRQLSGSVGRLLNALLDRKETWNLSMVDPVMFFVVLQWGRRPPGPA